MTDAPADEDALVIPSEWHPYLVPRRGGHRLPIVPIDKAIAEATAQVSAAQGTVERLLSDDSGVEPFVQTTREHQAGNATPLGAAVVACIVASTLPTNELRRLEVFADAWAAEYGLFFAAEAVVELAGLTVSSMFSGSARRFGADSPAGEPVGPRPRSPEEIVELWPGAPVADRVRTLLADTEDETHRSAIRAVERCVSGPFQQVVAAYLAPSEQLPTSEATRIGTAGTVLRLCTTTSLDEAARLLRVADFEHLAASIDPRNLMFSLVEGLAGTTKATQVAGLLLHTWTRTEHVGIRSAVADALAGLPSDQAFTALIGFPPATPLVSASRRFPRRALRLLSTRIDGEVFSTRARHLLVGLAASHPELAAEAVATLSNADKNRLTAAIEQPVVPETNSVPTLLATPPWPHTAIPEDTTVVGGLLHARPETTARWAPGERQDWLWWQAEAAYLPWDESFTDWADAADAVDDRYNTDDPHGARLLAEGPPELVGLLISTSEFRIRPSELIVHGRRLAARFHESSVSPLLYKSAPHFAPHTLLPFCNAAIARLMAEWFADPSELHYLAKSWLSRHGAEAAKLLFPDAVGTLDQQRQLARHALWFAARGHESAVIEAAEAAGSAVARSISALLAADPASIGLPAHTSLIEPDIPRWLDIDALPPLLVSGGERRLPRTAVGTLVQVLQLPWPDRRNPALTELREQCDPASLAELCWQLFLTKRAIDPEISAGEQQWPGDDWTIRALGIFGDDNTIRDIGEALRGNLDRTLTVALLSVLSEIGTDRAWTLLNRFAHPDRLHTDEARLLLATEAYRRGCSVHELAEQTVPRNGFPTEGPITVDYGRRRFTASLDDTLQLRVTDRKGKRVKGIPRPTNTDDPHTARHAYLRLTRLHNDLLLAAEDLTLRLNRELARPAHRSVAQFRSQLDHPLLRSALSGLLWFAATPEGERMAFRVAEDRTFADIEDNELRFDDRSTIALAHPAELEAADLLQWSNLFGEYRIVQPIAQLGREVHRFTEDERASFELRRFAQRTITFDRFDAFLERGWSWSGRDLDSPFVRRIAPQLMAVIEVDTSEWRAPTLIETVWLNDHTEGGGWGRRAGRRFGDLDPGAASELLGELIELFD